MRDDKGRFIVAKQEQSIAEKIQALLQEAENLKSQRKDEILAGLTSGIEELKDLGFSYQLVEAGQTRQAPSATGEGRRGRPKGFKMSEEQRQRMKEGRAKAKAAREAQGA